MRQGLLFVFFAFLALIQAVVGQGCNCSPSDTGCLSKCVETTQSCIQNCRGDESCFSGCIQDHWPTSVSYTSAPSPTASPTDATRAATSLSIHPSASVSGSVAQSATATPNSAQRAMLSDNHFKQNSLAIAILAVVAAVFL